MHVTPSRPASRRPSALAQPSGRCRQWLTCAAYVLGLMVIFLLSLLLLPDDAGLGKLIWSTLNASVWSGA